jgi:SAM-dependent methyltransferase
MRPPRTPRTLVDPAAWDQYWHDQLSRGVAGFVHIFCNDGDLVDLMRANGLKTVLCVGNGISQEPRALAWAGFNVTALDLSPFATEVAKGAVPSDELLARLVGGRSGALNGKLEFVAGDLRDAACCPGPYDVVIDRKTLQLYPDEERAIAMRVVANRLASPGIFFCHCHDGTWTPPVPRRHPLESWFVTEGWTFWRRDSPLTGRVAWLYFSTG